jgi:hypothetical protein
MPPSRVLINDVWVFAPHDQPPLSVPHLTILAIDQQPSSCVTYFEPSTRPLGVIQKPPKLISYLVSSHHASPDSDLSLRSRTGAEYLKGYRPLSPVP